MPDTAISLPETIPDYLEFPANQLLEAYGAGSHIPGSGSAAALSALLAIELLATVCKLTLQKPRYSKVHKEFRVILDTLETEHKSKVRSLFAEDIASFNAVSKNRILRDGAVTKKDRDRYDRMALQNQREATRIPLELGRTALSILPIALTVFDNGFKGARGDSGVAISNLLSAVSGTLYIVLLNLKSFRKSRWRQETRSSAEKLAKDFESGTRTAFAKILELYEEGLFEKEKQLSFSFLA